MQHNKLEDYIYVVKNALSLNLCDEILMSLKIVMNGKTLL
jgi:hypothetical protein